MAEIEGLEPSRGCPPKSLANSPLHLLGQISILISNANIRPYLVPVFYNSSENQLLGFSLRVMLGALGSCPSRFKAFALSSVPYVSAEVVVLRVAMPLAP